MIFRNCEIYYLSAEASLGDRVSFPWQPRSGDLTEIVVRMTAREGVVSQLRRVVILEGPSLSRCIGRAFFHHQLLFALRDRQTLVAAAMPDVISLKKNGIRKSIEVSSEEQFERTTRKN